MHRLIGSVQKYDWGDTSFLPSLLNVSTDGQPWAELWFGTHHMAPSRVETSSGDVLLSTMTGDLDILVKILAAARPLSLQTHPTREQAEVGFAAENARGVPLDSPLRTYRDTADKPELIIALTAFHALCGFAPLDTSVALLHAMEWRREADYLEQHGIHAYLEWVYANDVTASFDGAPQWLSQLAQQHPGDHSLCVAPLLHYVELAPGEALSLPAGNVHAYLKGAGLEVMTSSDNVVRAGFTQKHVDVAELLRIVDARPLDEPVVRPVIDGNVGTYPCPTDAFSVQRIELHDSHTLMPSPVHRIIVMTDGSTDSLPAGHAAVVAPHEQVDLRGTATVWVCAGRV
jgi:mannose-6-phosphate isomerase